MVFAMVVIGGFTRLTESGLSMTDWHPVTGWLPPLSEAAWQAQFDAYRRSPEYNQINAGMSLFEFKEIFWLEYLHRLFGPHHRLGPLRYRLRYLRSKAGCGVQTFGEWPDCWCWAACRAFIGWWMVKSGLIDRPDVSQVPFGLAPWYGIRDFGRGVVVCAKQT